MYADYHVHTIYSDDSAYPMEEVVLKAIDLGLNEICFTDHVDYGIKPDRDEPEKIIIRHGMPLANVDYPKYFEEIKHLQEKYKDKITIKQGMEFGMQTHTIDKFQKLFDYVK